MNTNVRKANSKRQKELYDKLQLVYWKDELDGLTVRTGKTFRDVSDYMGLSYSRDVVFYTKIPRKRTTLIGIGMAFGLSLEEINRWLESYGNKNRLYAKDIFGDLVWIYLINCNSKDSSNTVNYYSMYDRCLEEAVYIYTQFYSEDVSDDADTDKIRGLIGELPFDSDFEGLRGFIIDNIDAFKSAYSKPRRMLNRYVECILDTRSKVNADYGNLNSLRGYLDDSMINYLAGSPDTIHVIDRGSRERSVKVKSVPKWRRTHLSLCLALGMTMHEINDYLGKMGYAELSREDPDERLLLKYLDAWDDAHPLQKMFKGIFITEEIQSEMSEEEKLAAVNEMLQLRQSLKDEYAAREEVFPYMNA